MQEYLLISPRSPSTPSAGGAKIHALPLSRSQDWHALGMLGGLGESKKVLGSGIVPTSFPPEDQVLPATTHHIRKARLADLPALLQLEQVSFSTDLLSRARMRHWITATNGILLVATPAGDSNNILGYALVMTRKNSTAARLYSLATAAAARGQGIGAKLMHASECEACRRGRDRIRLEVAEGNAKALALYESLGYTHCGYIEAFYEDGQNAVRMEKTLK